MSDHNASDSAKSQNGPDAEFEKNSSHFATGPQPIAQIYEFINRAETLLSELAVLHDRLRKLRQDGTFAVTRFRDAVRSERSALQRGATSSEDQRSLEIARGSNLPFYEYVWGTAKHCKDIVALNKRICPEPSGWDLVDNVQRLDIGRRRQSKLRSHGDAVLVDVISDGGLMWTKVSLTTNTRLLFDLAKQGWQSDGSDHEDSISANGIQDEQDSDVPLLKIAKELIGASKRSYILTRHPIVRLVLPRLWRGQTAEVDNVLDAIEDIGVIVKCQDGWQPPPALEDSLAEMVRDPVSSLSETLNIDCTILLALVSDLSHFQMVVEPQRHASLQKQSKTESIQHLLPSILYPVLGNRKLVCTSEAAKRMREIVETIATPSEKARTKFLLGDDLLKSQHQLVADMQKLSTYDVPTELQLPVAVVDENVNDCLSKLPTSAKGMCENLGSGSLESTRLINKSIFLHGWATGRSTITSNRTAVKQLEQELQKCRSLDRGDLPSIWLCPVARSLVGKEKTVRSRTLENGGSKQSLDPGDRSVLDV